MTNQWDNPIIICERCKREKQQWYKTKKLCQSCYVYTSSSEATRKRSSQAVREKMGPEAWNEYIKNWWKTHPEKYEAHKKKATERSKKAYWAKKENQIENI